MAADLMMIIERRKMALRVRGCRSLLRRLKGGVIWEALCGYSKEQISNQIGLRVDFEKVCDVMV
jgi:hypothetical protein